MNHNMNQKVVNLTGVDYMSDESTTQILPEIDIFTKQILGKKILDNIATLWQEEYDTLNAPTGNKKPFRLYIINDGSTPGTSPSMGSPVRCVKLCKRIIEPDYPKNTLICSHKSKVTHRYELVLLVEFENGSFYCLTLPKNLSNPLQYNSTTTKAFVDPTVINSSGTPVPQHQSVVQPYESLIIIGTCNNYSAFEYCVSIPFVDFVPVPRPCELEDPSLQSYILLKDLKYDVDVLDTLQVTTGQDESVWTTIVDLTITEDIIDKLGIDQDIIVHGIPEFVC